MIVNQPWNQFPGIEMELDPFLDWSTITLGRLGGRKRANVIRLPNGIYTLRGTNFIFAEGKVISNYPKLINNFSIEAAQVGEIRDLDGKTLWRNACYCVHCHSMNDVCFGYKVMYFCSSCKLIKIISYHKEEVYSANEPEKDKSELRKALECETIKCQLCHNLISEKYAIELVHVCQNCHSSRFAIEIKLN